MYLLVVSSRVPAFCVSAVARALLLVCFGRSNTRACPDVTSQGSLSTGRHPVSRVVQRTLAKYASLPVGVDQVGNVVLSRVFNQVGNLALSLVADLVGNLEFSCCVPESIPWYESERVC